MTLYRFFLATDDLVADVVTTDREPSVGPILELREHVVAGLHADQQSSALGLDSQALRDVGGEGKGEDHLPIGDGLIVRVSLMHVDGHAVRLHEVETRLEHRIFRNVVVVEIDVGLSIDLADDRKAKYESELLVYLEDFGRSGELDRIHSIVDVTRLVFSWKGLCSENPKESSRFVSPRHIDS